MLSFPAQLWLIPALPLFAGAILSLTNRHQRKMGAAVAIGAMALSFGVSCLALASAFGACRSSNFAWFEIGEKTMQLGWLLDPLGAFMCGMVTFVGLLIFIFSVGYMRRDENYVRFFCFLSL